MADEEKVKLFISTGCAACEQIQKMVSEGRFNLPEVDMIDLSSEEGFHYIADLGLNKVPTAMKGTKTCPIYMDEESVFIDCGDNPPA